MTDYHKIAESLKNKNIKLFIATPAYQGNTHASYAVSLSETRVLLQSIGIECAICIPTGNALLCSARNSLLKKFLDSDCTHMLCIDSDLGWSHFSVLDMLSFDLEFVCGLYPTRDGKEYLYRSDGEKKEIDGVTYTKMIQHEEIPALFKAEYVPAGFMLMKRCVIKKMIQDNPQDEYIPKDGKEPGHALFNTEVFEGEFWGEDFVFCRKLRKSGFDIWVYPYIQFCHNGVIGCFADKLANSVDKKIVKKLNSNG